MGKQIIKQPNGKYSLFDDNNDKWFSFNMEKEHIIELFLEKEKKRIVESVNNIIDQLDNGEKPYYQFTISYDEMIEKISESNDEESTKYIKAMTRYENPIIDVINSLDKKD